MKRVIQVSFDGKAFVAIAVEQQADKSGKQIARDVKIQLQDAVVGLARKLA